MEFKVDPSMNSGIQFRSNYYTEETEVEIAGKKKKFPADRVHGYQFEIDPAHALSPAVCMMRAVVAGCLT